MHLINESRVLDLHTAGREKFEAHTRVVGIDARWHDRGFAFERHMPTEVIVRRHEGDELLAVTNDGLTKRLLPYVAAPVLAMIVSRIFRAKG